MRLLVIAARVVGYRCLQAVLDAGHHVTGLLTLHKSKTDQTTAFKSFTPLIEQYNINTFEFTSLNAPEVGAWIKHQSVQLGIVAGVSQLLPDALLSYPEQGVIGMHPTLLPHGRGRAPIPWAIIKGLNKTGVTWFQCQVQPDRGAIVAQAEVPIFYEDTAQTLGARTDICAVDLLLETLNRYERGEVIAVPQDDSKADYWPRRVPADGVIQWNNTTRTLYDWVRALTQPYPGAFTYLRKRKLYVWSAQEANMQVDSQPGTVIAVQPEGVYISALRGSLLLRRVQWEGADEITASQSGLRPGECFDKAQ